MEDFALISYLELLFHRQSVLHKQAAGNNIWQVSAGKKNTGLHRPSSDSVWQLLLYLDIMYYNFP